MHTEHTTRRIRNQKELFIDNLRADKYYKQYQLSKQLRKWHNHVYMRKKQFMQNIRGTILFKLYQSKHTIWRRWKPFVDGQVYKRKLMQRAELDYTNNQCIGTVCRAWMIYCRDRTIIRGSNCFKKKIFALVKNIAMKWLDLTRRNKLKRLKESKYHRVLYHPMNMLQEVQGYPPVQMASNYVVEESLSSLPKPKGCPPPLKTIIRGGTASVNGLVENFKSYMQEENAVVGVGEIFHVHGEAFTSKQQFVLEYITLLEQYLSQSSDALTIAMRNQILTDLQAMSKLV